MASDSSLIKAILWRHPEEFNKKDSAQWCARTQRGWEERKKEEREECGSIMLWKKGKRKYLVCPQFQFSYLCLQLLLFPVYLNVLSLREQLKISAPLFLLPCILPFSHLAPSLSPHHKKWMWWKACMASAGKMNLAHHPPHGISHRPQRHPGVCRETKSDLEMLLTCTMWRLKWLPGNQH